MSTQNRIKVLFNIIFTIEGEPASKANQRLCQGGDDDLLRIQKTRLRRITNLRLYAKLCVLQRQASKREAYLLGSR